LYEAEIVAEVETKTADVLTVNVAVVAPAGTITLEGTLATVALLLESMTVTPPAGAGLLRVTVPVEDCKPPTMLDGLNVREERVGGGGGAGVTVREADLVAPPYAAEMLTVVDAATALVVTVKVALVAPAANVTLDGTLATAVLLLESATCAPPAGAGPLSVTVPVEEFPPVTLAGFSDSEESETDAGAEDSSKSKTAGLGSFSETATNLEGETI
jgi:hypothetical protein